MTWLSAILCAAMAITVGFGARIMLSRLSEPPDADDKVPYATLATPAVAGVICVASLLALLLSVVAQPWPAWLVLLPLGTFGVVLAVIDAKTTYLPRSVVWTGGLVLAVCVTAVALLENRPWIVAMAAIGAVLLGGLLWVMWRFTGGIGFGDVRLAAFVGGSLGSFGLSAVMLGALLGSILGIVWGLAHKVADARAGRPPGPFPYGPSLVAGPYAWLVWMLLPLGAVPGGT